MNQENKQLPMASDYLETVYGTKNFARSIAIQDAPSLMGLMEDFADHCSKPLREELEKLRAENQKLREALGQVNAVIANEDYYMDWSKTTNEIENIVLGALKGLGQ